MIRPIEKKELAIIQYLVHSTFDNESEGVENQQLFVEEMDDGGMGSLRISEQHNQNVSRVLGRSLVEAKFYDSDSILVSIVLNVDSNGDLFELDLWKVDFSPLQSFPSPDELEDIEVSSR